VALGELLAVGPVQQRQVGVARHVGAQRAQDEHLLGRVGEVVVAAHDVGDPHLRVVDRDGEVVERRAVAARDHEVVLGGVRERHRPADHVLHHGLAVVGDAQADGGALLVARRAAVAAVAVLGLPGEHVLGGRRVAVGDAGLDQAVDRLLVPLAALELAVGALVPVELEPPQGVDDLLDVLGGRALAVGVLDPQDEGPAAPPRHQPVVERGARAADVERARGRRREAHAHGVVRSGRHAGSI